MVWAIAALLIIPLLLLAVGLVVEAVKWVRHG